MAKDPYKYFRIEARDLLDGLDRGVLELEKAPSDKDLVGRLLRLAHTLKGAARVVKQPGLAQLAHAVEDRLVPHRDTNRAVEREGIDELLRLLDGIRAGLASLDAPPPTRGLSSPEAAQPKHEEPFEAVRVELAEMDALLDAISQAGVRLAGLRLTMTGFDRARRPAETLPKQPQPRMAEEPTRCFGGPAAVPGTAEDLRQSLERTHSELATGIGHAERALEQVRQSADRLRLIPASAIFPTLERAARDAASSLGKSLAFETIGGENRLDAHVLAALRDALLHVVRNAAVHGIEPEVDRLVRRKPRLGRIELRVEQRGSRVAFVCRDDGGGIDVEAVRLAAIRRGSLSAAEGESLAADDILRLVFQPGLTTSGAVTELSGRGIGLDVVREAAARLKGEVRAWSDVGRGTTVEIDVPVSLSSLVALRVEAGAVPAWIPLDAIRRTLRVPDSAIARTPEGDAIQLGETTAPFLRLAGRLGAAATARREDRPWSAVVVQSGSGLAAVGVDRLLGAANVVIRALPAAAGADPLVAGVTLDAEGQPQLVLEPGALVAAARNGDARAGEQVAAPCAPVLVVDDSLTSRMLEQSILESAGYDVELSASAEEALGKAQAKPHSLFIVDIEMPGMDGFEFVERTRSDPVLRHTPAILVTSLATAEHRRRGEEVGARAYIVKSDFDERFLLETIRGLIG
jgi:two-component system chemotaxis sensor kinase CheA